MHLLKVHNNPFLFRLCSTETDGQAYQMHHLSLLLHRPDLPPASAPALVIDAPAEGKKGLECRELQSLL